MIMAEKRALIEASRVNGTDFAASHSFMDPKVRLAIEQSKTYQILRKMPKGVLSSDFVTNVSYKIFVYLIIIFF